VDDDDNAQVEWVVERVQRVFPYLAHGALLLISSQLPVGTTRRLETLYHETYPDGRVTFGYSPENLRLGAAIKVFTQPDRVVVGLRQDSDRERVTALLRPFIQTRRSMSVEATVISLDWRNDFLVMFVTIANWIAMWGDLFG